MGGARTTGSTPMSDKHVHQPDFRCCLWSVDRSTNNITRGRGPRLRYHRILRQGPRSVLLTRNTPGRRLFLRTQLGDHWFLYSCDPHSSLTTTGEDRNQIIDLRDALIARSAIGELSMSDQSLFRDCNIALGLVRGEPQTRDEARIRVLRAIRSPSAS